MIQPEYTFSEGVILAAIPCAPGLVARMLPTFWTMPL